MQLEIGAFGKLPLHGDFIRIGQVAELAEFDTWLQAGIYRSQQAMGREWMPAFDALPSARFVFHSRTTGGLLVGVFRASQDRPGRRYPFLLAARLPALPPGLSYEHLPLALADFLAAATTLLDADLAGLDLPGFTQKVAGLEAALDVEATRLRAGEFLAAHTSDQLWSATLPGADAARRATLLHDLAELMQPPFPKLLLHLPSSGAEGEVAFWLGLLARWMPADALPTLVQWSAGDQRLRLLFDQLDGRYFEPVCWPLRDNDHSYDLTHGHGAAAAHVQTAEHRFGACTTGGGSLQDISDRIAAG